MPLVVGVSFRKVGKVYYFDPGELQLHEGDFVIAETARGVEFGEVVLDPREVPEEELVAPLKQVVRLASASDMDREASNRDREAHAFEVCERKVAEHKLPMKLLEAEYAFDGSQVTFSFSAEGRVDFRELVKDVASALRTKVQLHQIGVRDEAKLIGGYGTCGRPLCCATYLSTFDPVSMKMAKDQSLFLNPAKFSGVCGKLMCCLRYEHEFYKVSQKCFPSIGAILQLEQGRAKVIDVNFISGVISLQTEDEAQLHIHASKLNLHGLCRRHGIGCAMSDQHCEPLLADADLCAAAVDEPDDAEQDADADIIDEVLPDEGIVAYARSKSEILSDTQPASDAPDQASEMPDQPSDAPKQTNGETKRNKNRRGGRNGKRQGGSSSNGRGRK